MGVKRRLTDDLKIWMEVIVLFDQRIKLGFCENEIAFQRFIA